MSLDSTNRSRLIVRWSIAVACQSAAAMVALSFPSTFGSHGKITVFGDVLVYFEYALPILEGRLPYRDYAFEYPPLAIPLLVAPLAIGRDFKTYQFAFAGEMLLVNALTVWLVARWVERSEGVDRVAGRLAWYSAAFLALCPMIVSRFDLAPTLLAFASAGWCARGRGLAGGLAAGLGALVKLVPALVLVPSMARPGPIRPRLRTLAAFAAIVVVGGGSWWWFGGEGVARSFRYHGERGLEIGSLASSGYLLAHTLAGVWVCTHFDHGSLNLAGPGAGDAARLAPILQVALLALVAGRAREAVQGDSMRFAAAALLAYILPGKVLSPQYVIWLFPLVAALGGWRGRWARGMLLACCVLTTVLYPYLYHALSFFEPVAVAVQASRNLGLALIFAILLKRDGVLTSPRFLS